MPPPSSSLVYRPRGRLAKRTLGDETVLVDARGRKVFLMNLVGATIWDAIERGAAFDAIVSDVVARFRVEETIARADVEDFLRELESCGLAEKTE